MGQRDDQVRARLLQFPRQGGARFGDGRERHVLTRTRDLGGFRA